MANFIKPYNNDPSVGHLSTPISNSAATRAFLGNLPAYRPGLSPLLRGLEVGMAHGYLLVGPFDKFGPLRNSPAALLIGFLSAIGLINHPLSQEIVFLGSLGIVIFLMRNLLAKISSEMRKTIVGTAIIVFAFRSVPNVGSGMGWFEIDILGFDQRFFSILS